MAIIHKFLSRYKNERAAAVVLKSIRAKFIAKRYPAREKSPIGATKEEIAAWAKELVARRERKKRRKLSPTT